MRDRDIVIVGLQPWDIEIGSNCKNIALEFAKSNRVLYINPPIGRKTLLKDKAKPSVQKRLELIRSGNNLIQVDKNFWTLYPSTHIRSINWIPSTPAFRVFNKWNNIRFANDIRAAINKVGFSNFILFNDSDMLRSYHLKELLKPAVSIYYSRDNLMVHKYWYRHGHILEPELMRKSDLVVANSTYLANVARKFNPKSFDVGQGCDLSIFDPNKQFTQPADIAAISKPIIGYIGAVLSHRLDLALLEELSRRKPEWHFVFVGKCDDEFNSSPIQQYPNVRFLGLKEERLLPDYLSMFDVAMNPQKINDYTIGNYPRKIDEYLALGKPVVATATATMETFKEVTYLGETVDDYIRLIQKALDEDNPTLQHKRMALARTHTWENSVQGIYDAIAVSKK